MRRNSSSERVLIAFPLPEPRRDTAGSMLPCSPGSLSSPVVRGCGGGPGPAALPSSPSTRSTSRLRTSALTQAPTAPSSIWGAPWDHGLESFPADTGDAWWPRPRDSDRAHRNLEQRHAIEAEKEQADGQHHGEISRLLPPHPCKRSAWERFYAALQLPETAQLLIIGLQSCGAKSFQREERTDGQPERGGNDFVAEVTSSSTQRWCRHRAGFGREDREPARLGSATFVQIFYSSWCCFAWCGECDRHSLSCGSVRLPKYWRAVPLQVRWRKLPGLQLLLQKGVGLQ